MTNCTRASHRNLRLAAGALLLAALAFSFVPASAVRAATVTVTDQTDTTNAACAADGTTAPCSLRDAVTYANANAGTTISVPAGTYNLTGGELVLSADMTITGAGASSTFVQPQSGISNRILHQTAGTATITSLTLRNGFASGTANGGAVYAAGTALTLNSSTISNSGADLGGGGIYVNSGTTVTLNDCTVSNNQQQTGSSGDGGGGIRNHGILNVNRSIFSANSARNEGAAIYNYLFAGAVTITNSTFSGNVSNTGTGGGGAISQHASSSRMTITNSTFSGNNRAISGGALYNTGGVTIANSTFSGNVTLGGSGNGSGFGGAIYNSGSGTITNSTFSGNTSSIGSGGALYSNGSITLTHVTFSGDSASASPATNEFSGTGLTLKNSIVNGACTGGVTSQDYNLASGSGCWTAQTHDLLNTNPNLGPLQDNGGPTFTMAIPRTSPAIEKIPSSGANCAATDQRGITRPQPTNGMCDIGAFEVEILNPTSLVMSGFSSPQTAGVAGAVTISAQDAQGNVAFGYTGTIHFTSTDPQASLPTDYTFVAADQGVHTFPVTLKTAGTQTITAKDTADFTVTVTQSGITVNPATAASLAVIGHPSSVIAGTPGTVTLTLRDAYNNLATNYTGTVHFTSSDPQAALPTDYSFTAGTGMDNGTHTFTNGITLKTAGIQSITATDTTAASVTGKQTGVTVNAAAMTQFLVTGYPATTQVSVSNTFTVIARDGYGNTISGYGGAVHFTSDDAQAILPADYTFGAADAGVHAFTATLKTPGTRSITATDTVSGAVTGTQSAISVITTTPTTIGATASDSQSATVHTAFGTALAIAVTDAGSNPVSNVVVTFLAPASGASGTFLGGVNTVNVTTNASGVATAPTFTANTIAGAYSVTATANGVATPATFALTNTPNVAASFVVGGLPSTAQAGASLNFTLTAKDQFGNTATGYTGTVRFILSDAAGTRPANYTFTADDNGTHTFAGVTFKSLGAQSLTATDTVNDTLTGSQPVQVAPGPAVSVTVTDFPSPVAAGSAAGFTVIVRDAFGNTASGYTGTVHFTSTDGAAVLPADYIFTGADQGVHSFIATLKTPGPRGITATDTVTSALTGTQSGITVTPAASVHLVLSAPANATAGTAISLTVTAKDSLNNTATGYTRTVRFTSSDSQAVLPGDYTFVAADNGAHTFQVVLKTAGSRTITATDLSDGTVTGSVAVTVSGPTVAAVSPINGPVAGGTKLTVTGTNLQGVSVTVGGAPCTGVQVNVAGTSMTCITPVHTGAATVDVAVTTGSGSASAHNAFTYLEAGSVGVPAGRAPSSGASGASGSPAPAPTSR